jgi:hypothetical protein
VVDELDKVPREEMVEENGWTWMRRIGLESMSSLKVDNFEVREGTIDVLRCFLSGAVAPIKKLGETKLVENASVKGQVATVQTPRSLCHR